MIGGYFKTLGQFGDPALQKVVWRSLFLTLGIYVVILICLWFGVGSLESSSAATWMMGYIGETGVDIVLGLGIISAFFLSVLFMPAIMLVVVSFFLEEVAAAVEAKHYPGLSPARDQPIIEAVVTGIKFGLITVGLNVIALPLYFIPIVNLVAFYGINGYLLGREMHEIVSLRRMEPKAVVQDRRSRRTPVWGLGAVGTCLTTLPFINLFAPILAAGAMVHLVNSKKPH